MFEKEATPLPVPNIRGLISLLTLDLVYKNKNKQIQCAKYPGQDYTAVVIEECNLSY